MTVLIVLNLSKNYWAALVIQRFGGTILWLGIIAAFIVLCISNKFLNWIRFYPTYLLICLPKHLMQGYSCFVTVFVALFWILLPI